MNAQDRWQFWIDRGGTFTDIVGRSPDGQLHSGKWLSECPERYADAAIEGMRHLLGLAPGQAITAERVACVKMGTTVATNALLERRGEPTLWVTTQGFRDALFIDDQHRPRLFDRHIVRPQPLHARVIEAVERLSAQGEVLQALDTEHLRERLWAAHDAGLRSVAIAFLHGYRHPDHERMAAEMARSVGFTHISCSHEVSPLLKFVPRAHTTVADAYLSPLLRRYVQQVAQQLPGVDLWFMQSSGALTGASTFRGKDAVLSGPAGGLVGMARTALQAGHERVIGFDMGGTSTDVSHVHGPWEHGLDHRVAGVRLRTPMLNIHTVAAGGGSVVRFDGLRLRVGPHSAGAQPGPAAYGRGGPATVTDAQVVLGRLQAAHFPAVLGPGGQDRLDVEAARLAFQPLAQAMAMTVEQAAEGAMQLAVQAMAHAIKNISVAKGHDASACVLQCFGGAGGQHACAVAEALGMQRIMLHPLASVMSAYGMGLADRAVIEQDTVEAECSPALWASLGPRWTRLEAQALQALEASLGAPDPATRVQHRLRLRYQGSDTAITVDRLADVDGLRAAFEQAYLKRFSFLMPHKPLWIEALMVEAVSPGEALSAPPAPAMPTAEPVRPLGEVPMFHRGQWRAAAVIDPSQLRPGQGVPGPALVVDPLSTLVVDAGWCVQKMPLGHLELTRASSAGEVHGSAPATDRSATAPDPVALELFNHGFMNIAEQMGLQLQNTAHSVNIKERLDFSCALFDGQGQLVANAPHMPVHLGSMGESVLSLIRHHGPQLRPGDVWVLNDPYHGGTHLPDVTVITPVWIDPSQPQPQCFVGSRGHHADIGGITPGSMPPFSTRIEEEGVLLRHVRAVVGGVFQEDALRQALAQGPWPARNPEQNLADLQAQIAANAHGARALAQWAEAQGWSRVQAYMQHVQNHAEAAVRQVLGRLHDGEFCLTLDNGACIRVALRVHPSRQRATLDFTGTSAQLDNNFNAPKAVTLAAVLYVFRTLVDDDIPLNAGCLKPLTLIIPPGSLLDPHPPAAVVAGNVETSSAVTNALYGALGVLAGSPATMSNVTFGNAQHQYYETLAGGTGAGPRFDGEGRKVGGFEGAHAVQAHMTNSRLTDPEVLELRFPVRVLSHHLRPGSGGAGRWPGGQGAVRRLQFLEPMVAGILSNARREPAFGLDGGRPGAVGLNRVLRASGEVQVLGPSAEVQVGPGDVFDIHTPGGGGYGPP